MLFWDKVSLWRPGWPPTQGSTWLWLPSTGSKGVCQHTRRVSIPFNHAVYYWSPVYTIFFYKVILMCAFSKEIPYLFLYNCLLHFSGAFQSERGWKKLGRKLHRQLLLSLVWNVRKDAVLWGFHLLLWLLKWKWIFSTCFSHRSLEDYLKVQVTCTVGDGLCFHLKINATVVHL